MREIPVAAGLATDAVIVDVRRNGDSALRIFEWRDQPLPLALRIDRGDYIELVGC